jgi:hypothetical protein
MIIGKNGSVSDLKKTTSARLTHVATSNICSKGDSNSCGFNIVRFVVVGFESSNVVDNRADH